MTEPPLFAAFDRPERPGKKKKNRTNNRKDRGRGRACRHRAVTPHMQEVTSQDSAEDLVGTAPAQEQSGHTDMQEGQ